MLERLDPDPEFWEGTGARFDDSPKAGKVGWDHGFGWVGIEGRWAAEFGMRLAGFSKATFTTTK